jgi:hypothetical protein
VVVERELHPKPGGMCLSLISSTAGTSWQKVSVALYMDVHVPRPITRGLRRRDVDVLTAQEDGTARWDDPDLLDRAAAMGRVLFSQDADLLIEPARSQRNGVSFSGVIYAPQLALPIGEFIAELELIAKAGEPAELANSVQFLPVP